MEEQSFENRQFAIQTEAADYAVEPGNSLTLPLLLHNQGSTDDLFELSVLGIPSTWVSVPSPVVRLAAGEPREVFVTLQPPAPPHGRAGRHSLVFRVAGQTAPAQAAEVSCTFTVAALEVAGRIGILLAATEFPVAPGESITVPVVLYNQGLERDVVNLSVDGIPTTWVTTSSASIPLSPGQQREVELTIHAPGGQQSGAGRHPFKILAGSQAAPGQVTAAECTLTIATVSQFHSELHPRRIEAGEPARVTVENQGNIQEAFALTWRSPEDGLDFEPAPTQQLRVPPGEVAMAEFHASPRQRPLFGGEKTLPFTTRVQGAAGGVQNLTGEVVSRAMIPSWMLGAVLVLILAVACVGVLLVVLPGLQGDAPPDAPAATDAPAQPPEQPTAEPPPEQPTAEPPPVEPTAEPPPEEPTAEPPPEEPTSEAPPPAGQLPEEGDEGGLPCTPAAFGLALAPLFVFATKRWGGRS